MPNVAENDNNNPTSAAAYGLNRQRANTEIPREFSVSASRLIKRPAKKINDITPARMTDGEKPVTAIKSRTEPAEKPAATLFGSRKAHRSRSTYCVISEV